MKLVHLEHIEPGMVLAVDVHSVQGRLLLQQGSVIGEKAIRVCKIWGVCQVPVAQAAGSSARRASGGPRGL